MYITDKCLTVIYPSSPSNYAPLHTCFHSRLPVVVYLVATLIFPGAVVLREASLPAQRPHLSSLLSTPVEESQLNLRSSNLLMPSTITLGMTCMCKCAFSFASMGHNNCTDPMCQLLRLSGVGRSHSFSEQIWTFRRFFQRERQCL